MYGEWDEYVPVGERIAQGKRYAEKMAKKRGFAAQPIDKFGGKIAKTFWGTAWCENLESYSDLANRVPRGRTLARNGSIADLLIKKGTVKAIVGGSDVYKIKIKFSLLKAKQWKAIKKKSAGRIDSLMSLLQGRFDESVMADLSRQKEGLFPTPREIDFDCDCPDGAYMCKHIAAVLYGVGTRLDSEPETLFLLRGVDHLELITGQDGVDALVDGGQDTGLAGQDLSQIFGIEFDARDAPTATTKPSPKSSKHSSSRKKKTVKKKKAPKKAPAKKKAAAKKAIKKKAAVKKKAVKKTTPRKKATKPKSVKKKAAAKKPAKRATKK